MHELFSLFCMRCPRRADRGHDVLTQAPSGTHPAPPPPPEDLLLLLLLPCARPGRLCRIRAKPKPWPCRRARPLLSGSAQTNENNSPGSPRLEFEGVVMSTLSLVGIVFEVSGCARRLSIFLRHQRVKKAISLSQAPASEKGDAASCCKVTSDMVTKSWFCFSCLTIL